MGILRWRLPVPLPRSFHSTQTLGINCRLRLAFGCGAMSLLGPGPSRRVGQLYQHPSLVPCHSRESVSRPVPAESAGLHPPTRRPPTPAHQPEANSVPAFPDQAPARPRRSGRPARRRDSRDRSRTTLPGPALSGRAAAPGGPPIVRRPGFLGSGRGRIEIRSRSRGLPRLCWRPGLPPAPPTEPLLSVLLSAC